MLLRSLLPPGAAIPRDEHGRLALYRSLTVDRQLLVMLDSAATAGQVRPLLPSGSGCATVVTSRDSLAGLVAREGARRITVDVMTPDESVQLLVAGRCRRASGWCDVAPVGRPLCLPATRTAPRR
jgi:hypothetical protein